MGRATVWLSDNSEELVAALTKGIELPPGYCFTGQVGHDFRRLGLGFVVTSPEIPDTPQGSELPQLMTMRHSDHRVSVLPWGDDG